MTIIKSLYKGKIAYTFVEPQRIRDEEGNEIEPEVDLARCVPAEARNPHIISQEQYEAETAEKREAESVQRQVREFTDLVQKRLDDFARTKAYDCMLSACSYSSSTNPTFRREGQYCLEARDNTWAKANAALQAVMSGERAAPSWEELAAELPALEWPLAE